MINNDPQQKNKQEDWLTVSTFDLVTSSLFSASCALDSNMWSSKLFLLEVSQRSRTWRQNHLLTFLTNAKWKVYWEPLLQAE